MFSGSDCFLRLPCLFLSPYFHLCTLSYTPRFPLYLPISPLPSGSLLPCSQLSLSLRLRFRPSLSILQRSFRTAPYTQVLPVFSGSDCFLRLPCLFLSPYFHLCTLSYTPRFPLYLPISPLPSGSLLPCSQLSLSLRLRFRPSLSTLQISVHLVRHNQARLAFSVSGHSPTLLLPVFRFLFPLRRHTLSYMSLLPLSLLLLLP